MVEIKQQLINSTPNSYGKNNKKTFITVHETANTSKGADAQAHANLQSRGNSREANWHWQVDDKIAIQSFTHNFSLWAGGDGRGNGNMNSIHVEICVNSDGNYQKAVDNAVKLVRKIMKDEGISASSVVQHNHWSGKNCPRYLRDGSRGITWSEFKDNLTNASSNSNTSTSKPPTKPSTPSNNKANPNYNTKSIVTFLASIKQPFSMAHRKKLASYYNVGNGKYNGQASLNLQLLDLIKKDYKANGKLRTSKPKSSSTGSNKPKANLKVDGYAGVETIKAEQRYHGTPVDGKISNPSPMIKARQRLLGVKADGYEGYITITAEQKRYGTPQDGKISKPSVMIKERQRRLNKGKM